MERRSDFGIEERSGPSGIARDAVVDRIATGAHIVGRRMERIDIAGSLELLDGRKLHTVEV